jgi:methylated-DNA-[protein]-cysteine S-methyltransferase
MKWHLDNIWSTMASPLGEIRISASGVGLTAIWFPDQRHLPDPTALRQWSFTDDHPLINAAKRQLGAYFSGERSAFDLPLDLSTGTQFQQAVWEHLLSIPAGASQSYRHVAEQIRRPRAVRAVGGAVGHNPISIVVPCHRVVGANGSLTGYSGGLDRKVELLRLEGLLL